MKYRLSACSLMISAMLLGCQESGDESASPGADAGVAQLEVPKIVTDLALVAGPPPSLAGRSGYLVQIHTCDVDNAGTAAAISLTLNVRDANWNLQTLGPWMQDHTYIVKEGYGGTERYNDHERNQWDVYFYPETTNAFHIEDAVIDFNAQGKKPGWCWDRMLVTRVEMGASGWTWDYSGARWHLPEHARRTSHAFVAGFNGQALPAGAYTPGMDYDEEDQEGPALRTSLIVNYETHALPQWDCEAIVFRDETTGGTRNLGALRVGGAGGIGIDVCRYTTTYMGLPTGFRRFSAIAGPYLKGSASINVQPSDFAQLLQIWPNVFN